jgi:hypothetical protein
LNRPESMDSGEMPKTDYVRVPATQASIFQGLSAIARKSAALTGCRAGIWPSHPIFEASDRTVDGGMGVVRRLDWDCAYCFIHLINWIKLPMCPLLALPRSAGRTHRPVPVRVLPATAKRDECPAECLGLPGNPGFPVSRRVRSVPGPAAMRTGRRRG